jgi:hypothetical protein
LKKDLIKKLKEGFKIENYEIKAERVLKGRFKEERNLSLTLRYDKNMLNLLKMKVFLGRPPFYKPWVEIFNIQSKIEMGNHYLEYYESKIEMAILEFLSEYLEHGDKLFVEYTNDEKTLKELRLGVPPVLTRLGFKLFNLGFIWLKDWYYPEGFMEGGPKIEAEKLELNIEINKQLNSILKDIANFKYETKNKELLYRIDSIFKYIENNLH